VSTFQFKAVQLLQLSETDNPVISIKDGTLTITANREGDKIYITSPVSNEVYFPQTQVTTPTPRVVTKSVRRKPRYLGVNVRRGEDHAKAKLKDQDIREMRALFRDEKYRKTFGSVYGVCQDLATAYGVHVTTVYKIVHGQTWRHIKDA
jgi:hypothetical protein